MLSSSRSCLALCEFNDIDRCLGSNSMSSKVLSQSYSDSALRKDSGCGNGFVESQVGIQAEATRTVLPLSFTVLPPLEQRRQRRIRDLVDLIENFTNTFHELAKKMRIVVKEIFSNVIPNELAIKMFRVAKIESSLQQIKDSLNARKVTYREIKPSEDQVDFYIENFGSSLFTKLQDFISICDCLECYDIISIRKEESINLNCLEKIFQDTSFEIKEYCLRLQLLIRYVLYCTPRQHFDHRPLTKILNELNNINRRNFNRSSKKGCEKDFSESLPLESSGDVCSKKKKSKLKRRYSLDNSALRKLSSMSRGLSFGRKSSRCVKNDSESNLNEKSQRVWDEKANSHDMRQHPRLLHSSSYDQTAQNGLDGFKSNKGNQDKETSFDVYKVDSAHTTEDRSDGPFFVGDSSTDSPSRKLNSTDNSPAVSRNLLGGFQIDCIVCNEKCDYYALDEMQTTYYDKCHHSMRNRQYSNRSIGCNPELCKDTSKTLTSHGRMDGCHSADSNNICSCSYVGNRDCMRTAQDNSVSNGSQASYTTYDQMVASNEPCNVHSSQYNCINCEKSVCTFIPCDQLTERDTGYDSSQRTFVDHVKSIPGGSPTILKREISREDHSPTLVNDLDSSSYLYPFVGCGMPDLELDQEISGMRLEEERKLCQKMMELELKSSHPMKQGFISEKEEKCFTKKFSSDIYRSDRNFPREKHVGVVYPEKQRDVPTAELQKGVFESTSNIVGERCQKNTRVLGDNGVRGSSQQDTSKKVTDKAAKSKRQMARDKYIEIPVIEDTTKGIKVTVARAKKKLKDFASPRVARKKERNINVVEKEAGSLLRKESFESARLVNDSLSNDLSFDKSSGFHDSRQESFSSIDCSFGQSSIGNSLESPQSSIDVKYHRRWYKNDKAEKGADEDDFSPRLTARRSTSSPPSSANNDLSISSDFHSTVTKILRSNSMTSNSPLRIGHSTFYCNADRSIASMRVGSSEDGDDVSSNQNGGLVERKDATCSDGSNSTEPLLSGSNVRDGECQESIMPTRMENGCSSKEQAKPLRVSRSEPIFKSNKPARRLITNTSFDAQKPLQNFRKISQTRLASWSENFDLLLSDKDGVKIFAEFLKSEYSEENLRFWLACEHFKSLRGSKVAKSAQSIHKLFIEASSASEVNLDHKTRTRIRESLLSPSKDMFDTAQARIKELMAQDSYQRFIKSQMYRNLLRS